MSKKSNFCIIAIGYNRSEAMERLLNSIRTAEYDGDSVDLLISIDKGENQKEVLSVAENCQWEYGNKRIRAYEERQGLKKHIIACGDEAFDYDAIIVLEDDITVSKGFYLYAKQCVEFYGDEDNIAGISLYKHCINVNKNSFFEPEHNGFDCFFMQFAQSWGQCWTERMWGGFKKWYEENKDKFFDDKNEILKYIPDYVLHWGERSWLKYFMGYIVEKNLYFVYPYNSLSTNHSEVGEHNNISNNAYQVGLSSFVNRDYKLPTNNEAIKYDVFFERQEFIIGEYLDKKVALDLYGSKKYFDGYDILISTKDRPYKLINEWKLKYRPHELNCCFRESGKGIYVYDLNEPSTKKIKQDKNLRVLYDVKSLSWRSLLKASWYKLNSKIKNIFKGS